MSGTTILTVYGKRMVMIKSVNGLREINNIWRLTDFKLTDHKDGFIL